MQSEHSQAQSEHSQALQLVHDDLGPRFTLEFECGPSVRVIQYARPPSLLDAMGIDTQPRAVIYRGAWVERAELEDADLRLVARRMCKAPAFISAEPGVLLLVTRLAIDRARHRLRSMPLCEQVWHALATAREPKTLRQLAERVGAGPLEVLQSMDFGLQGDVLARVGGQIVYDSRNVWRALCSNPNAATFENACRPISALAREREREALARREREASTQLAATQASNAELDALENAVLLDTASAPDDVASNARLEC